MARRFGPIMAASAGILATAVSSTPAQASGNGTITTTISGVPSSLSVGGSFDVTFTVRSTSPYGISVDDLFFSTYPIQGGSAPTTGVSVQWDDPATGSWRASDRVGAANGDYTLIELGKVVVKPNSTFSYHAHVTMDGSAAPGSWRIVTNGISGYSLVSADGKPVNGSLDNYNMAQTTFRYGSGAGGGNAGPATPSATHSRTASTTPTSAKPVAPSATTAPPTAEASTAPPAPPVSSASPTFTVASPSSTTLSVTTAARSSGSGSAPYAVGFAAVLVAVFGAGGAVVVRRRRAAR